MKSGKYFVLSALLVAALAAGYFLYDSWSRESRVVKRISEASCFINSACTRFGIDSRLMASVVYGELFSNLNVLDEFDRIRAEYGFDPSVGFGQMRVSTFIWLEECSADGKNIFRSRDKKELVKKISNDSINIIYSACYIALIKNRLFNEWDKEPDIRQIGSYYSLGIDHGCRKPNPEFVTPVGLAAEEFYNSDKLLSVYPRSAGTK
jgi:hypothetical protein